MIRHQHESQDPHGAFTERFGQHVKERGEIGLTGIAAAITAAVHHATGVRVRELPVKIESLLA
jgi:CO/xanthine dehydrogenase Mo-binding subunit